MQDYRKLKVWEKAHELVLLVYGNTRSFPKEEQYGLVSQMRRAAVSISSNIAEGTGRDGNPELARFLQMALGSACELEYQLLVARDLKFLSSGTYTELANRCTELKRMLAGLLEKVRVGRQRSAAAGQL